VHNALLLDQVERTVVHGPFRPFPRSARDARDPAERTVLPKPPWFVTARTGAEVSEGFTRFQMTRNVAGLARTLALALRA
jgi:aldehyde dehydrogenase (NAD(P)+)